jgi:hypothetical protein
MRYFFTLILFGFSFSLNASYPSDEEAREELERVLNTMVPPVKYVRERCFPEDKDISQNDKYALEESLWRLLPSDIIPLIFARVDHRSFVSSVKSTCRLWYQIASQPYFNLNPYCLQEGIPLVIPQHLLVSKALNTKDGILKIASLYSVLPQHLAEWFNRETLEKTNENYEPPVSIEELSDLETIDLYPRLKVFAALNELHILDQIRTSIISGNPTYHNDINLLKILTVWESVNGSTDPFPYSSYSYLFQALPLNKETPLDATHPKYIILKTLVMHEVINTYIIYQFIHDYTHTGTNVLRLVNWAERYSDDPLLLESCAYYYDRCDTKEKALDIWTRIFELCTVEDLHIKIRAALKLFKQKNDPVLNNKIRNFVLPLRNATLSDVYSTIDSFKLFAHYGLLDEDRIRNLLNIVLDTHDLKYVGSQLTALCRTLYYAGQHELSTFVKDWLLEKGVQNTELAELLIVSSDDYAKEYLFRIFPTEVEEREEVLLLLSKLVSESEIEPLIEQYNLTEDTSLEGRLNLAFIYHNLGNHPKCEEYWGEVMEIAHQGGEEVDEMVKFFFQSFVEYGIIEEDQTNYFFELDTTTLLDDIMFVMFEEMKKLDD